MLLTIDVGNTTTKFGFFKGDKLIITYHMATRIHQMPDEYAAVLLNLMQHHKLSTSDVKDVIVCSVVPPLITTFNDLFQQYFHISPLVIEAGVKTGVRIRMDNPREVGADRIVNAAAALQLYGCSVIIIDLGTATTFDTVSKEGDYIGGAIAPGINTAAEALVMRTALLHGVEMVPPKHAIGTNTISAMQSGIVFGYLGLIEGIVARIQKELKEKAKVVATGGYGELMGKLTKVIEVVNPDITLIGLRLIYNMNRTLPE